MIKMADEIKKEETKPLTNKESIHTHEREKITSDKCHVMYHVINTRPGAGGGYDEVFIEVSDVTSEIAYATMRKLILDNKKDDLDYINAAVKDGTYNDRASRAMEVG